MADPSRFRFSKNGPEQSASYNQRWQKGCFVCKNNIKLNSPNEVRICKLKVVGFPHLLNDECMEWVRK